ncbi:MAG: RNA methyltransferase [Candidatus Omnitrophica bacterium]|nr:RNA methyltransferase [Candidatus Omnitrophota bacterium]
MRKLTHSEIVSRQISRSREPRLPFEVVLDNIRSLDNVGSVFRTADGIGVRKLWLCGITGYPPQGGIAKTALGAEQSVPWEYQRSSAEVVRGLKQKGFHIVVMEQSVESIPLEKLQPCRPVCLVLGNEVDGVGEEICEQADALVEIDMLGVKNSLNVAVAFGIAAFQIRTALSLP